MVEGILVVNLDPPYVGFVRQQGDADSDATSSGGSLRNCTVAELKQTLLELGAITTQQQWPPQDCTVRVPGSYSDDALAKAGLVSSRKMPS